MCYTLFRGDKMNKIIGQRLKALRENTKVSQAKLAKANGKMIQTAVYRYENSQCEVPSDILLWYADYFDVSLDYIYGRCDNPQGKLYDFKPKVWQDNEQMQAFVEMCFDPASPANSKLKETLLRILEGKQ